VLLRRGVERILAGRGEPRDLVEFETLARTMKATSRCGLGQTSSNPVTSSLASFRPLYEGLVQADPDGLRRSFDLDAALADAARIRARGSDE
jgi:[NiFe] hydrogenase diaphorase moiety large subunit